MTYRNEQSVYSNRVILLVTLPLVFLLVNKKTCCQTCSQTCSQNSFPAQQYFSIRHDNDFLNLAGKGTDRYYTSGIYIQYSFLSPAHGSIMKKVLFSPHPLSPSFFTIGITQWMYTPANLKSPVIVKGDYPYAGILFFYFSRENLFTSKQLFRSELWLGMMGPSALAEQAQLLVHHIIKSRVPVGWKYQLPDYPVINYNLYYESNLLSASPAAKVNGMAYIQIGSLLNSAVIGLDFLISNEKDNFFPGLIYTLNKKETIKTGTIYLQFLPAIKFIVANSILQGGFFGKKDYYHINSGDLQRIILEGAGVIGIRTGGISLQYKQVMESPEFKTVHSHVYGCLSITWRI